MAREDTCEPTEKARCGIATIAFPPLGSKTGTKDFMRIMDKQSEIGCRRRTAAFGDHNPVTM
ncbi:hypothetical protein GLYMA_11G087666v4 [Glycine max]|nr:hypothetical protein GLYMA_11G087666v4 [Glycine max]KAH1158231.1 hypothetical protein GYH30_030461 [Glycine max]